MSEALITPQDIKSLLRRFCRNFWLVVAGAAAGGALAYWTIYTSPKLYEARATLLIESPRYDYDIATLRALGIYQPFVILENEMRLLQSDDLMKEALRKNNMQVTYIIEGRARKSEIFKGSPVHAIPLTQLCEGNELRFVITSRDSFALTGARDDKIKEFAFYDTVTHEGCTFVFIPNPRVIEVLLSITSRPEKITYRVRFNNIAQLTKQYARRLKVTKYDWPATYLDISITDAIPERAVALLDTIATTYIEWSHRRESEGYLQALKIIDQRINEITNRINELQKQLSTSQPDNLPPAPSTTLYPSENLQEQLKQLLQKQQELQSKLELLRTVHSILQSNDTLLIVPAVVELLGIEALSSMFKKLLELQNALEDALRTRQPSSPAVTQLKEDIAKQRQLIILKLKDYTTTLEQNLLNTQREITTITEKLQKSYGYPSTQLTAQIELELAKRLYSSLAEKKIAMELSQKQEFYKRKLIQSASITGRIYPQTGKTFLTHIGMALAIAFFIIGIRELFFDTLDTPEDFKRASRAGFLCALPTSTRQETPLMDFFLARLQTLLGNTASPHRVEQVCIVYDEEGRKTAEKLARLIEQKTQLASPVQLHTLTYTQLIHATVNKQLNPERTLVLTVFRACKVYKDHLEKSYALLSSLGFQHVYSVLTDYSPLASWLGLRSWQFIISHLFKPITIPCA